jgi:UDP-N-acetylmuramate dehydrogenase
VLEIKEHILLAPYSTFGVGGPAQYFATITRTDDLAEAVGTAKKNGLPIFILGGSSNILISDEGIPGLVLRILMKGREVSFDGEHVLLRIGAGEEWDSIVAFCVEHGWSGIECLSGIPGSVGASPVQNIGAYGHSIQDVLVSADVFDTHTATMSTLSAQACALSYRTSIFKTPEGSRYIITHVLLRLSRTSLAPVPSYHDLALSFAGHTGDVPIADIRRAVIEARAKKGMVLIPGYEHFKSAGSFFKNPIIEPGAFIRVQAIVKSHPDGSCADPWFWAQHDGRVKVAAACLLECAGFPKGFTQGSVGISARHALAIVNTGGARASDIAAFAKNIQERVYKLFGVSLEREVQYVGL